MPSVNKSRIGGSSRGHTKTGSSGNEQRYSNQASRSTKSTHARNRHLATQTPVNGPQKAVNHEGIGMQGNATTDGGESQEGHSTSKETHHPGSNVGHVHS